MSGTSMDAIDVALVEFSQKAKIKHYRQFPIDESLRRQIRPINEKTELARVAEADNLLGHVFAEATNQLLRETKTPSSNIVAIGSHGQTVFHRPAKDWHTSIQIGDPNIIAAETGVTTVADFRRMDMALGGQGAPLAPAFHRYQFRDNHIDRSILNIGGIANITNLPADKNLDVAGFDTGPGNGLLDDWNFQHNQTSMDKNSLWATTGTVIPELLLELEQDPYFSIKGPKSTGRDYFNLDWLNLKLAGMDSHKENDIQATLLELSMKTIADAVLKSLPGCKELFVCGGGARNPVMLERLQELLPLLRVSTTEQLGIDPDAVEAVTFAWLAYCRVNDMAIDFESITGSRQKVLAGAVYKATG